MKDTTNIIKIQNKNCPPSAQGGILPLGRVLSVRWGAFFLSAIFLLAATSFLVARGETVDKPNAPSVAINCQKLADAIYHAENSKTHPYGILKHYKKTTPRQACINTIKSAIKRYKMQGQEKDFIIFLSKTYCPIGAKNDPKGLNKNWVRNVTRFYKKEVK